MKKFLIIFTLVVIVLLVGGIVKFFDSQSPQNQSQENLAILKVGNAVFQVEIADTIQKHIIGLSGRNGLEKEQGMLFVFNQPSVPNFWMKGMKFPLDIVWIGNSEVMGLEENLLPNNTSSPVTYSPPKQVDMVLEINAGASKESRIRIGDKVSLEIKK